MDWELYIDALIDLKNNNKKSAISNLMKINEFSNDNKLLNKTEKLIKKIKDV